MSRRKRTIHPRTAYRTAIWRQTLRNQKTIEIGQTYKLHEVKTLTEYNLSKDVSFTVQDTTEVQTVKMINRKKTGQIEIKKYDGNG